MNSHNDKNSQTCVAVFSGGQDSTICLHWALDRFDQVKAVFFQYGQRHQLEKKAAQRIAQLNQVELAVFRIDLFKELGSNALVDSSMPIEHPDNELPNTFVPGRNLIFLTYAASYAYSIGVQDMVIGVCQTDYSGYPDCRQETVSALARALGLGLGKEMRIHTPLMNLSKAQSIKLAQELGAMESLAFSHTCYEGLFPPCRKCPACKLREQGFREAGIPDPLLQRAKS
jgi:7-cyano-7-deazaguanine synthase